MTSSFSSVRFPRADAGRVTRPVPLRHAANHRGAQLARSIGNRNLSNALRQSSSAHHGKDGACGCGACTARGAPRDARDESLQTKDAGSGAVVALAPAAAPAIKRTVSIYAVQLPGSTRAVDPDVSKANSVWNQCSVAITSAGGESWASDVLDRQTPNGVLNEYSDPKSPTTEETELLAYQPGGASVIHAYFVPSMSAGSRGEAFLPSITPSLPAALVISDSAASDTLAHELGHILLDAAGHSTDPDNLMASGTIRNVGVDKLDATQCGKV